MITRAIYRKKNTRTKRQSIKRKAEEVKNEKEEQCKEKEPSKNVETPKRQTKKQKTQTPKRASAAMRPTRTSQATYYLKDLKVVFTEPGGNKPGRCVQCVNYHREDIFGEGGENLNKEFNGAHGVYLIPVWTPHKEDANVTGFQLVASNVEDPTRQNLYAGFPGVFVYLVPTFDPSIEDRIIGVQLFRSRQYNPPKFGWSHTTTNINEGRGGDHLCLQWDLGNEQDVPGAKFRFRFWRR